MDPGGIVEKYRTIITNMPRTLLGILPPASLAAALWALLSLAAALLGFGNPWYLGILLPAGALFYLLVAWLLYLREDGLVARGPAPERKAETTPHPLQAETGGLYARPDEGIIARAPSAKVSRDSSSGETRSSPRRAKAVLLLAAIELAILAALLYSLAGVGAVFAH
jgi:hypothetical protein